MKEMLRVELNEETGDLILTAPTRDETLSIFEHMESVARKPMTVDIEGQKPGVALLLTFANVITRAIERHRIEQLQSMLKAVGIMSVSVDDNALIIEEETKH